jgi:hypothetical protein
MRLFGFAAAAMLLLSSPSIAADPAPIPAAPEVQPVVPPPPPTQPEGGQQTSANDPDKVVCKKVEGETGTRLSRRTKECHTQREWDQMEADAKKMVDDAQRETPGGLMAPN